MLHHTRDIGSTAACELEFFRNEPQNGFSRVKVDSMNAKMKQVYGKMIKKRGLRRTGEIVEQVNHIIKSNMSGKRSEYLSSKERKSDKRRSLRS
ncbi:hypothetical protein AWC38_SpisGene14593 [Stylophora pistillata]|uniref:Uncharacterized protein n=1 Tax=Stylophora pistillata TaxID=50429 RepID=A0A2B4RVT6_STYPI|nr:hypothetical protein AWC38_SpisGene14593 [Stylophora pistillata]